MSFRLNGSQQMSLTDAVGQLTAREQKALEKSWAKVFADEIFPAIDESRFRVLYSAREQSRSNTSVNICIGALIIKEMFQISDDEVVENLMLDPRYQYALHTTSFDEQPLSDKTLSRFRARCYNYESLYGVDLLHECVVGLSAKIAEMMKLSPRIRRMYSMMIEANIKVLSRAELLYTCVRNMALRLRESGQEKPLEETGLGHYCDPGDYNHTFYYSDSSGTEACVTAILRDADALLKEIGTDYEDSGEFQLLVRCLSEQTVTGDGTRRLRTGKDEGLSGSMMQNPSDPDATYREKNGKGYHGYAANMEETVGANGSAVTDYQLEKNTYSDSQFMKDSLGRKECGVDKTLEVADGAYSGEENLSLASQKNVQLITTALTGREVPDIYADFELNPEGTRILKCPADNAPRSCCCSSSNGHIHASFPREACGSCPNREKCRVKEHKNVYSIDISGCARQRAKARRFMKTEEFRNLSRIRNGVESLPSIMRKIYHSDRMPVRGLIRSRFFFGVKVAAVNVRKLLRYLNGSGHYAKNPLLT